MRKSPLKIVLADDQRRKLVHVVQSPTAPNGEARRARMVLLFVDGIMHGGSSRTNETSERRVTIFRYGVS